ncbi:MAG TPA: HAMP domain-containing sensor histidine kinase [Bacteriovoracaceae bacterium]|nr:HAMP domain-containing sensor histidine kinase [Bacteriovoracaceae bacterium]
MTNKTSDRLRHNIIKIMGIWENRALLEVRSAHHQESLALRDALPEYLEYLADTLAHNIDRTAARKIADEANNTRVGKKHGRERAVAFNYTMDQMIMEYHILRQVVCDVLEEEFMLTPTERELIVCSVEQAVNDAATEFSNTLKDLQEHLTQTLAHDLRNPLTAALVNAGIIMNYPENIVNSADKAKHISVGLKRIDKMITELLDSSRTKAGGNLPLAFGEFDLDWLLRETTYELNLVYQDRFMVTTDGSCIGNWNENGFRRLIENLASNAIKYSTPRTKIKFMLVHDADTATLDVINEGNPIVDKELDSLFVKFKRARTSETKIGWGIGLTVVKDVVDAHRGSVAVTSDKENGTKFKIRIPKNPLVSSAEMNTENGLQSSLN